MTGVMWAAASGVGFGVFQVMNGRAVRSDDDIYASTFVQLAIAAAILAVAALSTERVGALTSAPPVALLAFCVGGLLHFFLGWTLLNLSHQRIGAARTSPLLSTTPLFGLAFAAIAIGQLPGPVALVGVCGIMVGAYLVSGAPAHGGDHRQSLFALGTACLWAVSAIVIVKGLKRVDSPLLGVALGMVAAVIAYAALLPLTPGSLSLHRWKAPARGLKLAAGIVVGLATWARWVALDETPVAVVLGLSLLSVPVVLVLAPLLSGAVERVSRQEWAGAALIMAGTSVLIFRG